MGEEVIAEQHEPVMGVENRQEEMRAEMFLMSEGESYDLGVRSLEIDIK